MIWNTLCFVSVGSNFIFEENCFQAGRDFPFGIWRENYLDGNKYDYEARKKIRKKKVRMGKGRLIWVTSSTINTCITESLQQMQMAHPAPQICINKTVDVGLVYLEYEPQLSVHRA